MSSLPYFPSSADRYLYIPFANLSTVCQARVNSGITCPIFISVQGWSSMVPPTQAVYTLTGEYSGNPNTPLPLTNGFPVWTYVPSYGYAYLSTQVSWQTELLINCLYVEFPLL